MVVTCFENQDGVNCKQSIVNPRNYIYAGTTSIKQGIATPLCIHVYFTKHTDSRVGKLLTKHNKQIQKTPANKLKKSKQHKCLYSIKKHVYLLGKLCVELVAKDIYASVCSCIDITMRHRIADLALRLYKEINRTTMKDEQ